MFQKKKPKNLPKRPAAPEPTAVYKRPTAAEKDRTETLEILLGDVALALEKEEVEQGSDPHNNTQRPSVDRHRFK